MIPRFLFLNSIILLVLGQNANATSADSTMVLRPWTGLGHNIGRSFIGWNSLLHLSAAGATYGLMNSGADYETERYFHEHPDLSAAFFPVAITGLIGPVGISAFSYYRGWSREDRPLFGAGCALIQANAIAFAHTSLLKAATGRPYPNPYEEDMNAQSRTFRFGFFRGGIFWGWPSGHTSATVATASCLAVYYPDRKWLAVSGYLWSAYTMIGVAAVKGGNMHWLSDGVAGALTGFAIGSTVGHSFRRIVNGGPERTVWRRIEVVPVTASTYQGMGLAYKF